MPPAITVATIVFVSAAAAFVAAIATVIAVTIGAPSAVGVANAPIVITIAATATIAVGPHHSCNHQPSSPPLAVAWQWRWQ